MPTIDQLDPVIVAADDDALPTSQGGAVRRVTRSQLLAGTQTVLSLTPGLLGRFSPGVGAPQQISIGNGLRLSGGVLSGVPPFTPSTLPRTSNLSLDDLIPVSQGTYDRSTSLRHLLSAGGADLSNQVAQGSVGAYRSLSEWFGDAVPVEAFGATGDGDTDDTNAFVAAVGSGRPVRLGPKIYRVDGQWTISTNTVLIGTRGLSGLHRKMQNGGAWISVNCASFSAFGIGFDAGSISGDSWAVLVTPSCVSSYFQNCRFSNATGKILGSGLTIQARDDDQSVNGSHIVENCIFDNNGCHGLWLQAASDARITGCSSWQNTGYGICVDFNDPTFNFKSARSRITDCVCTHNARGISVGNYNETNLEPPRWGLLNPDVVGAIIAHNVCHSNLDYQIAVSGSYIQVCQNFLLCSPQGASGLLCNSSNSVLTGNVIVGPGQFGIDAGGSSSLDILSNIVTGCSIGINAGGSKVVRINDNKIRNNQRSITIFQVETDGGGANFGIACADIWIEGNILEISEGCGGVSIVDGPERVTVSRNKFIISCADDIEKTFWCHTDSFQIEQNEIIGGLSAPLTPVLQDNIQRLIIPELVDSVSLGNQVEKIDAVCGLHQSNMRGKLGFIRVVDGGNGYTRAALTIIGVGVNASARAYIRDGKIIGVAVDNAGDNYDGDTTAVLIDGDGTGAILRPQIGLLSGSKRLLSLSCNSDVCFPFSLNSGIANWTGYDITVAAGSTVVLKSLNESWQALQFDSVNYLTPDANGDVVLQNAHGGLELRSGQSRAVRFCSEAEPTGILNSLGRGSPEGIVVAPPGSDYRNLDGGIGTTLWLKRTGSGNTGWFALA